MRIYETVAEAAEDLCVTPATVLAAIDRGLEHTVGARRIGQIKAKRALSAYEARRLHLSPPLGRVANDRIAAAARRRQIGASA